MPEVSNEGFVFKLARSAVSAMVSSWETDRRGRNLSVCLHEGCDAFEQFIPFGSLRDLHEVYESPELFPLFTNRVISKKRPEYRDFLRWLDLEDSEADPLVLLARTARS